MAGSTAHAPDQPKKKKKRSGRGENPLAGTAAVASSSAPAPQPSFTSPTKEPKKRKHSTLSTEVIPDNDVGTEADDAAAAAAKKARKKEKKRSKRAKREAEEREAEAQGHALTEAIRRKVEGVEAAGRQQEEQQAKQAKKEKKEKGKGKAPEGEVGSAQREATSSPQKTKRKHAEVDAGAPPALPSSSIIVSPHKPRPQPTYASPLQSQSSRSTLLSQSGKRQKDPDRIARRKERRANRIENGIKPSRAFSLSRSQSHTATATPQPEAAPEVTAGAAASGQKKQKKKRKRDSEADSSTAAISQETGAPAVEMEVAGPKPKKRRTEQSTETAAVAPTETDDLAVSTAQEHAEAAARAERSAGKAARKAERAERRARKEQRRRLRAETAAAEGDVKDEEVDELESQSQAPQQPVAAPSAELEEEVDELEASQVPTATGGPVLNLPSAALPVPEPADEGQAAAQEKKRRRKERKEQQRKAKETQAANTISFTASDADAAVKALAGRTDVANSAVNTSSSGGAALTPAQLASQAELPAPLEEAQAWTIQLPKGVVPFAGLIAGLRWAEEAGYARRQDPPAAGPKALQQAEETPDLDTQPSTEGSSRLALSAVRAEAAPPPLQSGSSTAPPLAVTARRSPPKPRIDLDSLVFDPDEDSNARARRLSSLLRPARKSILDMIPSSSSSGSEEDSMNAGEDQDDEEEEESDAVVEPRPKRSQFQREASSPYPTSEESVEDRLVRQPSVKIDDHAGSQDERAETAAASAAHEDQVEDGATSPAAPPATLSDPIEPPSEAAAAPPADGTTQTRATKEAAKASYPTPANSNPEDGSASGSETEVEGVPKYEPQILGLGALTRRASSSQMPDGVSQTVDDTLDLVDNSLEHGSADADKRKVSALATEVVEDSRDGSAVPATQSVIDADDDGSLAADPRTPGRRIRVGATSGTPSVVDDEEATPGVEEQAMEAEQAPEQAESSVGVDRSSINVSDEVDQLASQLASRSQPAPIAVVTESSPARADPFEMRQSPSLSTILALPSESDAPSTVDPLETQAVPPTFTGADLFLPESQSQAPFVSTPTAVETKEPEWGSMPPPPVPSQTRKLRSREVSEVPTSGTSRTPAARPKLGSPAVSGFSQTLSQARRGSPSLRNAMKPTGAPRRSLSQLKEEELRFKPARRDSAAMLKAAVAADAQSQQPEEASSSSDDDADSEEEAPESSQIPKARRAGATPKREGLRRKSTKDLWAEDTKRRSGRLAR